MSFRRVALVLVTTMAVLIVVLAIVLVFQWLFAALGDPAAARVLSGFAVACLVMLVTVVLLLVGTLGLHLAGPERPAESSQDRDDERT